MLAASVLGLLGFALATSPGRATSNGPALGVYRGAASPGQVSAFGTWLGQAPAYALDYLASDSWTSIENPSWWLDGWAGSPYTVDYSVPLIPQTGGSLQQGASGAYTLVQIGAHLLPPYAEFFQKGARYSSSNSPRLSPNLR